MKHFKVFFSVCSAVFVVLILVTLWACSNQDLNVIEGVLVVGHFLLFLILIMLGFLLIDDLKGDKNESKF